MTLYLFTLNSKRKYQINNLCRKSILIVCLGNWSNDPRVRKSVESSCILNLRVFIYETGHRVNRTENIDENSAIPGVEVIRNSKQPKFHLILGLYIKALLRVARFLQGKFNPRIKELAKHLPLVNAFLLHSNVLGKRLLSQSDFIKLMSIIKQIRPSVIYIHDLLPLEIFSFRPNLGADSIVIWDAHEYYPGAATLTEEESRDISLKLNYLTKSLDGFLTVNEFIANLYEDELPGIPSPQIIYNSSRYIPITGNDFRLHSMAHLPRDQKILLFHGGLSKYRGIELLLQTAHILPSCWSVVFMGDGPYVPNIESTIFELQSLDKVDACRLIAPCTHDELPYWVRGATLGAIFYEPVVLNHKYASPNKLWEYAAAGVPIVGYALPFLARTMESYNFGWLFDDPITPEELAEFVVSLDDNSISEKSEVAVKFAANSNWQSEGKKLADYLQSFF